MAPLTPNSVQRPTFTNYAFKRVVEKVEEPDQRFFVIKKTLPTAKGVSITEVQKADKVFEKCKTLDVIITL